MCLLAIFMSSQKKCGLSFLFFYGILCCAKAFKFNQDSLLIFVFIFIILGGGSNMILLQFMPKCVLPMFSSRSFIVSGIMFRSLIQFEVIFFMVLENVKISFFYMQLSSFPSTTYFFIVYSCLICNRLLNHRCLCLFLGFLSFFS